MMEHRSGWWRYTPNKRHAKAKRRAHWFDNDAKWSVCGMMRFHGDEMTWDVEPGTMKCKHCKRMTTVAASAIG